MNNEQQDYDAIETVTRKVGGDDARLTMAKIFRDIQRFYQAIGPEGIVTVSITAHVPSRKRLLP